MNGDTGLILHSVMTYQLYLLELKIYDQQHPEDAAGYNAVREVARNALQCCEAIGVTNLDPLPEKK
ncbi:MAG: hypothetical protein LBM59_02935 [Ruminococcus sp.]|jgi:hypothetical protein|nr:hypothetical protein [Ruminococcus sp.]